MKLRSFQLLFALMIACLVFLGSMHLGIKYALHSLLVKEATSTGMDWAYHFEQQIADLPSMKNVDGTPDPGKIPDTGELTQLVSNVLAVGNIYQMDFINSQCFCEVSLGSYPVPQLDGRSSGEGSTTGKHYPGDGHNHTPAEIANGGVIEITSPSSARLKHVLANNKRHKPVVLDDNNKSRLPVDRELTYSIVTGQQHGIIVRTDKVAYQPATFAEVYHLVTANGEIAYVLRLLVDLEEKATTYAKLMHSGAAFILLLLALAFGYPARKFLLSLKKQRASDEHARYLANNDVLTGVANRNAFQEAAPRMLNACVDDNGSSLLFLVDIDKFKEINDFHGHHLGDRVLSEVAKTLTLCTNKESFVARIGGDEFAVLMCGKAHSESKVEEILNIPGSIQIEIEESGQKIDASFCIGMARFPRDGRNLTELMQHADLALYAAKIDGNGPILEYGPEMGKAFSERVSMFQEFRVALQSGQIVPFYQPLVDMKTGRVEGLEALARWVHPEKGILTPAFFHEALEDRELGMMVGSEMLRQVLHDMGQWKSDGIPFESVGINVGEGDLLRPGFALDIVSGLAANNLLGSNLGIEVTESCIFGSSKDALVMKLRELRSAGCYIALDDFGTGYSSITHIKELPFTTVKIDKSFVKKVVDNDVDQAIIQAMLDLGQSLQFKLVAEGIENPDQRDLLQSLGCDLAQGYLYSRPVPAWDVPGLIYRLNGDVNHQNNKVIAFRA